MNSIKNGTVPMATVLTSQDSSLVAYYKDQIFKNNPKDISESRRVLHMPSKQHLDTQEAGGGRPVDQTVICGRHSLTFLKFQFKFLSPE